MKKKVLCLLMVATVCLGMMVGCGSGSGDADKKEDTSKQEAQDKTDDKADASNADGAGTGDIELTDTVKLSGTYYSGQVVITLELNPDGTVGGEANGNAMEGTWEASSEDGVDIIATGKSDSSEMVFSITKESDGSYSATVDLVAGMVLTGK